jgi:hypothetical protein
MMTIALQSITSISYLNVLFSPLKEINKMALEIVKAFFIICAIIIGAIIVLRVLFWLAEEGLLATGFKKAGAGIGTVVEWVAGLGLLALFAYAVVYFVNNV